MLNYTKEWDSARVKGAEAFRAATWSYFWKYFCKQDLIIEQRGHPIIKHIPSISYYKSCIIWPCNTEQYSLVSHSSPSQPLEQKHLNESTSSIHVPPFLQGFPRQSLISTTKSQQLFGCFHLLRGAIYTCVSGKSSTKLLLPFVHAKEKLKHLFSSLFLAVLSLM